jgi:hypothetical protein
MTGVGYTDESGTAIIGSFDPMYYDSIILIVTGCDAWPQTITVPLLGTPENEMQSVTLYPNPNKGQFSISLPEEDCDIAVYNSLGQEVHRSQGHGMTTMSLEDLSEGLYFVTVKSEKAVSTLKFVKE